jgi:Na+/H+ antiporter NhaB
MEERLSVEFEQVRSLNITGEVVYECWCVKVGYYGRIHNFEYEKFEDAVKDWTEDQVIQNLKDYEILEDFEECLKKQKGFYYPSKTYGGVWVEVKTPQLEEVQN